MVNGKRVLLLNNFKGNIVKTITFSVTCLRVAFKLCVVLWNSTILRVTSYSNITQFLPFTILLGLLLKIALLGSFRYKIWFYMFYQEVTDLDWQVGVATTTYLKAIGKLQKIKKSSLSSQLCITWPVAQQFNSIVY